MSGARHEALSEAADLRDPVGMQIQCTLRLVSCGKQAIPRGAEVFATKEGPFADLPLRIARRQPTQPSYPNPFGILMHSFGISRLIIVVSRLIDSQ